MKHKKLLIILLISSLLACKTEVKESPSNDELLAVEEVHYLNELDLKSYSKSATIIEPNKDCGHPFDTLSYNKVIAYDFDGRGEFLTSVFQDGRFLRVIKKQQSLSQNQVNFITQLLSDTLSYGEVTAACFDPHLGFLFFLDDSIVFQANVCLDCNRVHSSIPILAKQHVRVDIGKEYERALEGFSESAVVGIISISKELGFRYGAKETKNLLIFTTNKKE